MPERDPHLECSTPTLADVAQRAGVSTATVSRCLNTPERVVESTRQRVQAVIQELGYSPNFGARALAARRTNTIGVIIPTMENAVFAQGLQALQEELSVLGMTMLVASSSYRAELEEEQIRTLVARGADGMLLIGHDRDDRVYRFLDQQGVPTLVAWAYAPDERRISIGFDNFAAMRDLGRKVIDLGHQRIAMISAEQAMNDRARERVSGLRQAMTDAGLDASHLTLIETPYGIDNGSRAFRTLMDSADRPTVVVCGNDVLAVGALMMARTMHLRVPQDVSITGFDDIELARVSYPALTTVRVPHREMGRQGAQMLAGMISGETPRQSLCLQTSICWRDTLAPPP